VASARDRASSASPSSASAPLATPASTRVGRSRWAAITSPVASHQKASVIPNACARSSATAARGEARTSTAGVAGTATEAAAGSRAAEASLTSHRREGGRGAPYGGAHLAGAGGGERQVARAHLRGEARGERARPRCRVHEQRGDAGRADGARRGQRVGLGAGRPPEPSRATLARASVRNTSTGADPPRRAVSARARAASAALASGVPPPPGRPASSRRARASERVGGSTSSAAARRKATSATRSRRT
jgi:hypothetical protein